VRLITLALCAALTASAAAVTLDYGVPSGVFNDDNGGAFFIFSSDGGASDLRVQQMTLTLTGPYVFNTTGVLSRAFLADPSGLNVGTPGFTGTVPSPVTNQSQIFTMFFNDFGGAETFRWRVDIDFIPNVLNASLVTSLELISALSISVDVGGPGYQTTTLNGSFTTLDFTDRGPGQPPPLGFARGTITGEIAAVPEPATVLMAGAALAGLAFLRGRQARRDRA